jgi:hypothetical protein
MTYSIVARDPNTGELGVAVQSHWFAVGPIVPWARPGIGAVATQANVEVSYGPRGLELLERGVTAPTRSRGCWPRIPAPPDARSRSSTPTAGSLCTPARAASRSPDTPRATPSRARRTSW